MKKSIILTSLLLLASCASGGRQSASFNYMASATLDSTVTLTESGGATLSEDGEWLNPSLWGFGFESELNESSAVTVALNSREYAPEDGSASDATISGWEIGAGYRKYMPVNEMVEPFVGGGLSVGLGQEFTPPGFATLESDAYMDYILCTGARVNIGKQAFTEASIQYQGAIVDVEVTDSGNTVGFDTSGLTYLVGFGMYF